MKSRVEELDIIRGFALFGILICNMVLFGYPLEYISDYFSNDSNGLDKIATYIRFNFFGDKTFTIFSLLFGVGIGMQYGKAVKAKNNFSRHHLVRMGLLLAIGCIHAGLFWYGDILWLYAVLGTLVLLFIRRPFRDLLWIATLFFLWPTCQNVLMRLGYIQFGLHTVEVIPLAELIAMNTSGGLNGHWTYNSVQLLPTAQFYLSGTLYYSLSMITLGIALVKKRIPFNISGTLPMYRKLLYLSGSLVVLWNMYQMLFFDLSQMKSAVSFYTYWALFNLSILGQTFFTIATLILMVWSGGIWARIARPLRYVGRLSLTNYIMHSIVGILIFKLLGFYGQSSPALDLLLAIVLTIVQIGLSKIWLKRFGMGPVENLWRRMAQRISG